MTRLASSDIKPIADALFGYNQRLRATTGRGLFGIGCHAWGMEEEKLRGEMDNMVVSVVPVTAGEGEISGFSQTVAAILTFLGVEAHVTDEPDVGGLTQAFRGGSTAVFMADDHAFTAFHLKTGKTVTNDEATGRGYAAILHLMAQGGEVKDALVVGCGRVGREAASALGEFGFRVLLYDTDDAAARFLCDQLIPEQTTDSPQVEVVDDLPPALARVKYIIEATPGSGTLPDDLLSNDMAVAAPGIPLGLSAAGVSILGERLVHDTLEIGVAAMLAKLLG